MCWSLWFQKLVEELYEYRDHYVDRFGLEKVSQKAADLDEKMRETLVKLDEMKGLIFFVFAC